MGDVHLDVEREGDWRVLQEPSEALFHQLHQEDGPAVVGILYNPQELDNTGMFQLPQDVAFLFETSGKVHSSGIVRSEEDGV